jgi:hypothetical protein
MTKVLRELGMAAGAIVVSDGVSGSILFTASQLGVHATARTHSRHRPGWRTARQQARSGRCRPHDVRAEGHLVTPQAMQHDVEPAPNDRSSAPARPRRLPPGQIAAIEALRRQWLTSPVIDRCLGLPLSTVGAVLRRLGRDRLKRLDRRAPVVRYQRGAPRRARPHRHQELGKIAGIGHSITGRRSGMVDATAALAGNTCASRSMTPRAWPTPPAAPAAHQVGPGSQARSSTSARPASSFSSRGRSPGSPATASPSSGS